MQLMTQETKRKIRELEQEKIALQEELAMSNSVERIKAIDEEIFEIDDTVKKLVGNNQKITKNEEIIEWYGS
tara:strand:+ start:167 stop:382 length:216 start_codon:yes stop_codon:yes gene_type:complete